MKTLFTTDFKNYNPDWPGSSRPSARAIILINSGLPQEDSPAPLSPDDKIALVYARNQGYYKFPGGGINEGEEKTAALIREVAEETGLEVLPDSIREYGVVHRIMQSEIFPETIFVQDSFHYFCQVKTGSYGRPVIRKQKLDTYEKDDGFELRLVSLKEAVSANVNFKSDNIKNLDMIARETHVMTKICGLPELMPRAYAEYLLECGAAKNPGPWREHSFAVALAAEKIARAVNENAQAQGSRTSTCASASTLNPDLAYCCGLLHDIGRQEGYTFIAHIYDGYHFLKNLGYDMAAKICLTHSFNLHTTDDYIGNIDISPEKLEELKAILASTVYDDYDRLIQLLDSTCSADGTKNLEARMNDVKKRYGYYPQGKWDKNFELKDYFEKLMNRSLYEVI